MPISLEDIEDSGRTLDDDYGIRWMVVAVAEEKGRKRITVSSGPKGPSRVLYDSGFGSVVDHEGNPLEAFNGSSARIVPETVESVVDYYFRMGRISPSIRDRIIGVHEQEVARLEAQNERLEEWQDATGTK